MTRLSTLCCFLLLTAACGTTLVEPSGIGREGGALQADGVRLTLPPGAVDDRTVFTIEATAEVPEGAVRPVEIGPTGTVFAQPVTLTFASDDPELVVATVINGEWEPLADSAYDAEAGEARATTTHLSPYALVRRPICGSSRCAKGLVCCPYTNSCYHPACLSCCMPPPQPKPDAGVACGATDCAPGLACCAATNTCYHPACLSCCMPGPQPQPDAGTKTCGTSTTPCGSGLSCCASTGQCYNPACLSCCPP